MAWERVDEGFFRPTSAEPCTNPTYRYSVDDDTTSGRLELQVSFDNAETPTTVTCFAARGNILNWASASKLDIQKKFLPAVNFIPAMKNGMKNGNVDNTDTTDTVDDRLVSEHEVVRERDLKSRFLSIKKRMELR